MKFSREFLDKLKSSVDLKELVEEYTELRKAGPTLYVGHCPHPKHNDSDASFCLNAQTNTWTCYGCHSDKKDKSQGKQLGDALSCYYSGNEKTGYKGYVQKVIANSDKYTSVRIPSIKEAKKELNNSPATSAGSESIVINSDHVTGSLISSNSAPSGLIF